MKIGNLEVFKELIEAVKSPLVKYDDAITHNIKANNAVFIGIVSKNSALIAGSKKNESRVVTPTKNSDNSIPAIEIGSEKKHKSRKNLLNGSCLRKGRDSSFLFLQVRYLV